MMMNPDLAWNKRASSFREFELEPELEDFFRKKIKNVKKKPENHIIKSVKLIENRATLFFQKNKICFREK